MSRIDQIPPLQITHREGVDLEVRGLDGAERLVEGDERVVLLRRGAGEEGGGAAPEDQSAFSRAARRRRRQGVAGPRQRAWARPLKATQAPILHCSQVKHASWPWAWPFPRPVLQPGFAQLRRGHIATNTAASSPTSSPFPSKQQTNK